MHLNLAQEQDTRQLGVQLAVACPPDLVIYLHGDLGTGKTTLVRAMLQALGYEGAVRSPTYTLIEPYEMGGRRVFHLDLYRLADPGELEYLGLRDLLEGEALLLVEWPSRGEGMLPPADLELSLQYAGMGRAVELTSHNERGEAVLERLAGLR
jgi:tRNA threonylcarbamoyladenosine biosynthesis protein TsaE